MDQFLLYLNTTVLLIVILIFIFREKLDHDMKNIIIKILRRQSEINDIQGIVNEGIVERNEGIVKRFITIEKTIADALLSTKSNKKNIKKPYRVSKKKKKNGANTV